MGSPSSGVPEYTVQDSANTWTSSDYWIPTNLHVHNYMVNYLNSNYKTFSGSNTWTSSMTFNYRQIGKIVIWNVKYTPNTTIQNSTGDIVMEGVPIPIGDSTGISTNNSDAVTRVAVIFTYGGSNAKAIFLARGSHAANTQYSASGCYLTNS